MFRLETRLGICTREGHGREGYDTSHALQGAMMVTWISRVCCHSVKVDM